MTDHMSTHSEFSNALLVLPSNPPFRALQSRVCTLSPILCWEPISHFTRRMRIISWILATSLVASLAASTPSALALPDSTPLDCSRRNYPANDGRPLVSRSSVTTLLTQCEAQERVAKADSESDQLEFDLLEVYRKKLWKYRDMEEVYTYHQFMIMDKLKYFQYLNSSTLKERERDMIYAEIWFAANQFTGDHPPTHNNLITPACLHKWFVYSFNVSQDPAFSVANHASHLAQQLEVTLIFKSMGGFVH